jgi:tetratricopeptide (TPR) repeat protein
MIFSRKAKSICILITFYLIGCATPDYGKKDVEELYDFGKELYQKYKYKEAIAVLDEALSVDPNNVKITVKKGRCWHSLGDFDKAIIEYDKAIELKPKNKFVWLHKGNSLYKKGNYVDAIECFSESLKINPSYALARVCRGRTFYKIGEYEAAHQENDLAIRINSKLSVAYNNKAWFLATCPDKRYRNGQKALENIKKAISLGPPKGSYLNTEAAVYAELGKYDKAIRINNDAIELLKKENKDHEINYLRRCANAFMARKPWRIKISKQAMDIPALSNLDADFLYVDLYRLEVAYQVNNNWKFNKDMDSKLSQVTSIVFRIMPDGEIKNIFFTKRSGNEALDESAFNAIVKTNPTKPFPQNINKKPFIEMGLRFSPDGVK